MLLCASAETAPGSEDAFLILDQNMIIAAVSKRAQSLLGVSESCAIDRHIDQVLTSVDPHHPNVETLETALARSARGQLTPRNLDVHVRTSKHDKIPLRARIGPCGPPPATLIVLADATQPAIAAT